MKASMQSALILKRENTLIYFQSAAASIIRTLQIKRAWRLVTCDYILWFPSVNYSFTALVTAFSSRRRRRRRSSSFCKVARVCFREIKSHLFLKKKVIS